MLSRLMCQNSEIEKKKGFREFVKYKSSESCFAKCKLGTGLTDILILNWVLAEYNVEGEF